MGEAEEIANRIRREGVDIYTPVDQMPKELVYTIDTLEALLNDRMVGGHFPKPARTRSKNVKGAVCEAMGYEVPSSFQKVQPRFPGQDLDVFAQQSNNLQIWNEEVSPTRRYALVRIDADDVVTQVRVIDGTVVSALDKTGTLTHKYQASRKIDSDISALVSPIDTPAFTAELNPSDEVDSTTLSGLDPAEAPRRGATLTTQGLFDKLSVLEGATFPDSSSDRLRGEAFHRLVCETLGLGSFRDAGQFPDVTCQALEVKLQTARTIDLGLVDPASLEPALTVSPSLQHRDCRYLIGYGDILDGMVRVQSIVVISGADFYSEFVQFGGLVSNKKLQIKLPEDLFS